MSELKRIGVRLVTEQTLLSPHAIHEPEDAILVMKEVIEDMDREVMCILNLKSSGVPINFEIASIGTISQTLANPRDLLKGSILSNAASVIFLHNHPGGTNTASKDDFDITKRLIKAYDLMGIQVIDHIIVANGQKEVYSMQKSGGMRSLMEEIRSDGRNPFDEMAAEKTKNIENEQKERTGKCR